jgi:hypothetical protein
MAIFEVVFFEFSTENSLVAKRRKKNWYCLHLTRGDKTATIDISAKEFEEYKKVFELEETGYRTGVWGPKESRRADNSLRNFI